MREREGVRERRVEEREREYMLSNKGTRGKHTHVQQSAQDKALIPFRTPFHPVTRSGKATGLGWSYITLCKVVVV